MTADKQLKVKAIENGTAIDHIPSESLFKIISILDLDRVKSPITFGTNLESRRMGTKAIIKIDNHYLADEEINRIAFVAPMARVNTIRNYEVVEKRNVEVPDRISLRCCYCEKVTTQDNMEIIK